MEYAGGGSCRPNGSSVSGSVVRVGRGMAHGATRGRAGERISPWLFWYQASVSGEAVCLVVRKGWSKEDEAGPYLYLALVATRCRQLGEPDSRETRYVVSVVDRRVLSPASFVLVVVLENGTLVACDLGWV